jgi:nicotinamidase-related amidase
MKTLLVVVDMQNDFVDGTLGSKEAKSIVPNVMSLIKQHMTDKDSELWFTMDTHSKNYLETNEGKHLPVEHCINLTKGWELYPEIQQTLDTWVASKQDKFSTNIIRKNTFGSLEFAQRYIFADFDKIIFCGLCTDICVVSNALITKANVPEKEIEVYADCCAGTTKEKHEAALDVMESCHITVVNRGKEPWKTV